MKKIKLKQEIFLFLTTKLVLLSFLWWVCFSHPIDKSLNALKMAFHLF